MSKRFRKVAAMILALVLVALFAGCGTKPAASPAPSDSQKPAEAPKPADKKEPVELLMWVFPLLGDAEEEKAFYKGLTDKFHAQNPSIKVNVEILPWTNRQQKMLTELAGGGGPDIAYLNPDILATFQSMNILHPIDPHLAPDVKADYQPHTLQAVTGPDGKIYGMPILQSVVTYFYNKDLFRKAGLDPEKPPVTWEEFNAALAALSKVEGIAPWWYAGNNSLNVSWFFFLRQAGGDVLTPDGKIAFNSPEGVRALDLVVNAYKAGYMPKDAVNADGTQDFLAGKVGIVWGSNGTVKALRKDAKFDWGVGPIMKDKQQVTYGTVGSYGVFKKTKHPAEAMKWLTFLTAPENMKYINGKSGFFPVKNSTLDLYKDDPVFNKLSQDLKYVKGDVFHPKARQIIDILIPEFQAAMLGKKTSKQALDDGAKKVEAAFKQP